jgi:hypothetical protein
MGIAKPLGVVEDGDEGRAHDEPDAWSACAQLPAPPRAQRHKWLPEGWGLKGGQS